MADLTRIRWWEWLPIFGWRIVAIVDSADQVPRRLPRNGAVLVGSRVYPKWIAFDCPCRTGHRILLNLDRARWPCWSTPADRTLSLVPSVDSDEAERRCHYFIRDGHIEWIHDDDFQR